MNAKEASRLSKKARDKTDNEDYSGRILEDVRLAAGYGRNEIRVAEKMMTVRTRQVLTDAGFSMARVIVYPQFEKTPELWWTKREERTLRPEQEWLISW